MKKTPKETSKKETSKQQQNNSNMLVFIFFYNHISFFLQSPKRSKSDSSDWEKKVKYHGKRRNALVPAMVRKKKLVHDFIRFNYTPYATFSVRKNKKKKTNNSLEMLDFIFLIIIF